MSRRKNGANKERLKKLNMLNKLWRKMNKEKNEEEKNKLFNTREQIKSKLKST
jgi:hypothetical protein|tara:strand:+ start:124 stop:282 length:159 start_codon:yes stop_codon:yes gene_type:complete